MCQDNTYNLIDVNVLPSVSESQFQHDHDSCLLQLPKTFSMNLVLKSLFH